MQRKLYIVFGGVCVLLVVLIGRLMYIEATSGKRYEKIVLSQQSFDSSIIPFQRGDITDARGTVLATSVDVYNVILDCNVLNGGRFDTNEEGEFVKKKVDAAEKNINHTIKALLTVFPELSEEEIRKTLDEKRTSPYIVLVKKTPYENRQKFQELVEKDAERKSKVAAEEGYIKGIWFEKEYVRKYPYNDIASAVIGFANSESGVIGLEAQYNTALSGVNGRSYGYKSEDNNLTQTVVEPEDGHTIEMTIDVNVQTIVQNELETWNLQHRTTDDAGNVLQEGSVHTACIVMNPKNGNILAMASYPSFDLNNPRDLTAYYSKEQLSVMSEEEKMDSLNRIWQNLPINYSYEPGSTFKPFTVAMGLETGTLTGNEIYECNGKEDISGFEIHCVNRNGHGQETVEKALWDSCNDALMQMSYSIGGDIFSRYQHTFGFGQKTNIDLPGEANTAAVIYQKEDLQKTINLATNSFGQNFNVTMIQLATGFSSLINGGNLYYPHVVQRELDKNGNVIRSVEPVIMRRTLSEEVSQTMKGYLYGVVREGTGKVAGVSGYNIGGKTGTAQKLPRSAGNYLVSFIGFAPFEDPEIVCYVIIDTPNVDDQPHSNYAQEIVHNIFTQILPYLNIETAAEEGVGAIDEPVDTSRVEYSGVRTNGTEQEQGEEAGTETKPQEPQQETETQAETGDVPNTRPEIQNTEDEQEAATAEPTWEAEDTGV